MICFNLSKILFVIIAKLGSKWPNFVHDQDYFKIYILSKTKIEKNQFFRIKSKKRRNLANFDELWRKEVQSGDMWFKKYFIFNNRLIEFNIRLI